MSERTKRHLKNYDGTAVTSRHLNDVLLGALSSLNQKYQDQPEQILAAWPDVIGQALAGMTQAVKFDGGVLTVKVRNSSLYSLLTQNDKPKILAKLRSKFPQTEIRTIIFRMG